MLLEDAVAAGRLDLEVGLADDGLLDRFPFREIYGIHNLPGLEAGRIATRAWSLSKGRLPR